MKLSFTANQIKNELKFLEINLQETIDQIKDLEKRKEVLKRKCNELKSILKYAQ